MAKPTIIGTVEASGGPYVNLVGRPAYEPFIDPFKGAVPVEGVENMKIGALTLYAWSDGAVTWRRDREF